MGCRDTADTRCGSRRRGETGPESRWPSRAPPDSGMSDVQRDEDRGGYLERHAPVDGPTVAPFGLAAANNCDATSIGGQRRERSNMQLSLYDVISSCLGSTQGTCCVYADTAEHLHPLVPAPFKEPSLLVVRRRELHHSAAPHAI